MGAELGSAGVCESEGEDVGDSELGNHVKDALRLASTGEIDGYNQLLGVMHHSERMAPEEVAKLVIHLKALSGAVFSIDINHHESLLSSIFGMSMWNHTTEMMDALMELAITLASSNGKYLDSFLEMLVSNFVPPPYYLSMIDQPCGILRKSQVLERVHSAFKEITALVPLTPLRLLPIVLDRMPRITARDTIICAYAENMLLLENSVLGELMGSTLLMAVVDRLIDLDVEIGWEDILQDDCSKGIFEMEVEDLDDIGGAANIDIEEFSACKKHFVVNSNAGKLDSLLVLTFEHLLVSHKQGRLIKVFETLLQSFQMTVLGAYKSKFAQFVMFYASSLDPESCGLSFVSLLANIFCSSTHQPVTRMSSVAHLASFLSRATFIADSSVITTLDRVVKWCSAYTQNQQGKPNPTVHRVFYSGCQAIMYVLCFRMRPLMDVPLLKASLFRMPIEAILKHPLNPLKVCLPTVTSEFLRQAKAARLFTVSKAFVFDDLLESDLSRAFGGTERLDMFFPYDPCLLKKCDRFIRPNFRYWNKVRRSYGDDDDAGAVVDSSDMDDDDDDDDGYDEGNSGDEEDDRISRIDFNHMLDQMSITPQPFKFSFNDGSQFLQKMPSRLRPSTSPESP